jgi:hypothetical protein
MNSIEPVGHRSTLRSSRSRPDSNPIDENFERVAFARLFLTAILFALSLSVFIFSPIIDTSDSMYSMVLSESILHHFSTHMNWFQPPSPVETVWTSMPPLVSSTDTYQLGRLHGNLIYRFPNGSSILSVPFVAVANFVGISATKPDGSYSKGGDFVIQKFVAALLMAVLVILVFRTCLLLLDWKQSLLIAVTFAFGTQVWSTATRQLWSHTWLIFFEGWVVYLLLRYDEEPDALPMAELATLLSWMYFVRATAAVPIACVTVFAFFSQSSRRFTRFALVGALWFAAFVGYSWLTFGELIPGYYHSSRLGFHDCWLSLAANLFSPSRGLFVYVPVSALVLYMIARHWFTIPHRRLAKLSLSVIGLHLLLLAGHPAWWGGGSYGARFMTDILPWLALLAILATKDLMSQHDRRSEFGWAIAIALALLSIGMNARGAISRSCQLWSLEVEVDRHPDRVFDWSYPQFAAGLVKSPSYAADFPVRLSQMMNAAETRRRTGESQSLNSGGRTE